MAEKLGKLEEQFEERWKRAYEVRHLENQNRHKAGSDDGKDGVQREPSKSTEPKLQKQAASAAPTVVVHASTAGAHAAPPGAQAVHSLPSTAVAGGGKPIRQQEVEDDDEDFDTGHAPCEPREVAAAANSAVAQAAVPAADAEAADADEEPECRVVWDSSHSSHQPKLGQPAAPSCSAAAQLKDSGTACLKQGDLHGALACYSDAVRAALAEKDDPHALAALYSNKSHMLHKLGRNQEAAADAAEAHRLFPAWPKPLYRLAQAQLALGLFAPAVGHCLKGESLSKKDSDGHTEFTPLLDRIAVAAAKAGSPAGYTGMLLEVRDAGEEAWLGRPAPYVAELDGVQDEDSHLPATHVALPSTDAAAAGSMGALSLSGASEGDALATWDYRQTAAVRQRRRTSFRSVKEAVTAAQDGDRILLRRGTHNGMGEAVNVNKRLLIMGEGQLGQTVIDQRANSPTFRITRGGVVIKNIDIDMSGFCEAIIVLGGPAVAPLIEDCNIKCSGDDGINVCGEADPCFRRCTVSVKKCGARMYGAGRGRFEDCVFEKCQEQAVKAMESSVPTLTRCTLSECLEEGVVAMESARVTLVDCVITGNKGPAVDCSDKAVAVVRGGCFHGNVGGVWAWDGVRVVLRGAAVGGGPSHAILADGSATLDVKDSRIQGSVHATDKAWEGILDSSNSLEDPDQPTDFPAEAGPFKFIPNRITRKQ